MLLPDGYVYTSDGFIHQVEHEKFSYTQDYKNKQGTNDKMSWLRFGWLLSLLGYNQIKTFNVCDVGSGNGTFVSTLTNSFKRIVGYDVTGESISKEELFETKWNLIVLSDVLEHFEDIETLFQLKWSYCYLSFPEMPEVWNFKDLQKWKHFKPNEHLWYFQEKNMKPWLQKHNGTTVMETSNFEDIIRTRWNPDIRNITSMMISRIL